MEGGRPGVFVVGSPGVGKRTLLSRLVSVDFEDSSSSSQTQVHDWTINTKYYSADVSVRISNICDDNDYSLPHSHHPLVALVMVFDLSQMSTLVALQEWVSHADITINSFDILLCIGNKSDLLPHTHDSASLDVKGTCLDWCRDNNIEFIEACASNPDFDKCLSVDGDTQGVERLFRALSAHMWPGMILKSADKINEPHGQEEEESEYELEYEVLSSGSATDLCEARPYDADAGGSSTSPDVEINNMVNPKIVELRSSGSQSETDGATGEKPLGYDLEEVEQLMSEIGNIRDNLRLMPDFQRREIAASLAMKMASMFGGGGGGDDSDSEEDSEWSPFVSSSISA
ncbi:uncharacterized protein LOC108847696 isoform X2 [Raphanus sativus]|uniref:Uncharacterized protein LOC108847696 isoform X2 n=1 Tax=Raphanus sativus TaxID=3726 RepID=A0A9W3DFK6_RAPSA|nr:uncharacterized protein LOC108847696 isoform X2 [Raphanus sativus]